MKSKIKVFFFIGTLVVSLLIGKASFSSNSSLSWYIGTTKSELWAMSHQVRNLKVHQLINANQEQNTPNSAMETKKSKLAQNSTDSLPYDFPLGWYDSIKNLDVPAKIAREGMNLIIPYTGKSTIGEIRNYLDRAEAAGIKVVVEIPRYWVRKSSIDKITTFVQKLKNHPATFGWYLYDEPEFIQLSPRLLSRIYQAIKTEDSQHPITIAMTRLIHANKYLDTLDALTYFNYPCIYDTPEFHGFENGIFKTSAQAAAQVAQNQEHFWFALQGYGEKKDGTPTEFNRRLPTADEQKYMIFSAILAKADGLFFWAHYRAQQQWINSVLKPLIQEVKDYLPAVTQGVLENKLVIADSNVQASLYRNPNNNHLLLIAINHGNNQVETAISIQENTTASSATVLKENRSVNLSQRTLTDSFEPYGVHIYQIN